MTNPARTTAPAQPEPDLASRSRPTSFVTGSFPRRRGTVVFLSVLGGFLLTMVWSASFVDHTIGDNVANTILGHDVKETAIAGIGAGIAFAFVSGLAGTFTACNIAAFGAVAPMLSGRHGRWERLRRTLAPIGWLAIGMISVSATYGAIVGIVGTSMPQFSGAAGAAGGMSPYLIQASIVFGIVGLSLCYLGLAALGLVPDPFARIAMRFPNAPMVFMGALIGAFLIGRPFALFRQLFRDAAESGNPLYGVAAFSLQSIGNIAIMAVLFLVLSFAVGARLQRWLAVRPARAATLIASAFLVAGAFMFLYWDVRLLARVDILPWYPILPWV